MPPYRSRARALRGFTLTELAMVLVIVALLAGGILISLSAQYDARNVSETQKALEQAHEALLGFAAANGRLPRPATSATDGTERSTPCTTDSDCTGFIPWQALGIRKSDSWGKLIRYSVTPAFANGAFTLTTAGSKKIQSRDGSGNVIYLLGQASSCNPCSPAVVFSQGKSRLGTNEDGVALGGGSATSVDEISNDTGSTTAPGTLFMSRTPTDNTAAAGGEFDDQVIWISPNILFNRMIAAGRLP